MDSERFQELVLLQLKALTEGQSRMENRLENLDHHIVGLYKKK